MPNYNLTYTNGSLPELVVDQSYIKCCFRHYDFGKKEFVSVLFDQCVFGCCDLSQVTLVDCQFFDCEFVDCGLRSDLETAYKIRNVQ